jgi:uncharacterized protein (TIGR02246 family)
MIAASTDFKMGLSKVALLLAIIACFSPLTTTIAADPKTDPDTSNQQKVAGTADAEKEIYDQLNQMVDAWNRHDIDAYVDNFWRSDQLIVVIEGENFRGWDLLNKAYHLGYPNPAEMGTLTLDRLQVQMIGPELGCALAWYTVTFTKKKELGTATIILKKLPEGWRVMISHTSFVEP